MAARKLLVDPRHELENRSRHGFGDARQGVVLFVRVATMLGDDEMTFDFGQYPGNLVSLLRGGDAGRERSVTRKPILDGVQHLLGTVLSRLPCCGLA